MLYIYIVIDINIPRINFSFYIFFLTLSNFIRKMPKNSLKCLVDSIFDRINPLPPYSLELTYDNIHISQIFKDITKIFIGGINLKYGDNGAIDIRDLTDTRMNNIKEYMYSIGITYTIKFIDLYRFNELQKRSIFEKHHLSDYNFNLHIGPNIIIIINFDYYIKPTVWNHIL